MKGMITIGGPIKRDYFCLVRMRGRGTCLVGDREVVLAKDVGERGASGGQLDPPVIPFLFFFLFAKTTYMMPPETKTKR